MKVKPVPAPLPKKRKAPFVLPGPRPPSAPRRPMSAEEYMALRSAHIEVSFEQRKTLVDLGDHECRWPLGDPQSPDFRYCGARRVEGPHPYCRPHMYLARPGWRG